MGLLDILNGMQNGPRGPSAPSDPDAKGGMSPMTMAILALLAYKAVKHYGGSQPGSSPAAPAPSPNAVNAGLPGGGGLAGGLGGGLGDLLKGGLGGLLAGGAAGSTQIRQPVLDLHRTLMAQSNWTRSTNRSTSALRANPRRPGGRTRGWPGGRTRTVPGTPPTVLLGRTIRFPDEQQQQEPPSLSLNEREA